MMCVCVAREPECQPSAAFEDTRPRVAQPRPQTLCLTRIPPECVMSWLVRAHIIRRLRGGHAALAAPSRAVRRARRRQPQGRRRPAGPRSSSSTRPPAPRRAGGGPAPLAQAAARGAAAPARAAADAGLNFVRRAPRDCALQIFDRCFAQWAITKQNFYVNRFYPKTPLS